MDKELTGYLYKIDWNTGLVEKKLPIPIDTGNPLFGGRGLCYYNGILYVATAMSILKYDMDLDYQGEITNKKLAGLHEIFVEEDDIWCTSTLHDMVLKIDFDGNTLYEWQLNESPELMDRLKLTKRKLNFDMKFPGQEFREGFQDYARDERLHLNTVFPHNGNIYILACKKSALIKIYTGKAGVMFRDRALSSPHNSIITEDGEVLINDTGNQRVRIYGLDTGKCLKSIDTSIYNNGKSEQFAIAGWQRGMARLNKNRYLIGTSPATIFELDIITGKIVNKVELSSDVKHCIHGLEAVKL
jgi:hypothetical protein